MLCGFTRRPGCAPGTCTFSKLQACGDCTCGSESVTALSSMRLKRYSSGCHHAVLMCVCYSDRRFNMQHMAYVNAAVLGPQEAFCWTFCKRQRSEGRMHLAVGIICHGDCSRWFRMTESSAGLGEGDLMLPECRVTVCSCSAFGRGNTVEGRPSAMFSMTACLPCSKITKHVAGSPALTRFA